MVKNTNGDYMKKYLFIFVVLILVGCSLSNNPTSRVEELLGKYQRVDKDIIIDTTSLTTGVVNDDLNSRYEKLIEKQYKNMSYEIKDEKIDGDTAVITTEVKVMDFKSVYQKYSNNNNGYDETIIDELENVKDKITYTIDFNLTRDEDGEWNVEGLTTEQTSKLLGIY